MFHLFSRIFAKLSDWYSYIGDWFANRQEFFQEYLIRPIRVIGSLVVDGFLFFVWLFENPNREYKNLFLGLPAVIALSGAIFISASGYIDQRSSGKLYWILGEQALANNKFDAAEIYLQKAMQSVTADRSRVILALARTYERSGSLDRAEVLMGSIAPIGAIGHPEAHLYLALQMADKHARGETVDLTAWDWHIRSATRQNPYLIEKLRADYYLLAGDEEKSLESAARAAEVEPSLWFMIASRQKALNRPIDAERSLERAKLALELIWRANPDNVNKRLEYVTALLLTKRIIDARDILLQGIATSSDPRLRVAMSNVCNAEADYEMTKRKDGLKHDFRRVAAVLTEAIMYTPNHPGTLQRLGVLARSESEVLESIRAALAEQIAQSKANEFAFYVLGVVEFEAGDLAAAERYTRQSLALAPNLQVAANNLAYFVSHRETPDLKEALELANRACSGPLQLYDFYDTRGEIFAMLGENQKAITDYLMALKLTANPQPIREKLAELYDKTGESTLAAGMRANSPNKNQQTIAEPSAPLK